MKSGITFWFTGLSGSGKSTLTKNICILSGKDIYPFEWLDGNKLRGLEKETKTSISKNLGFSFEDRKENLRRAAEISKLFNHYGDFYSKKGINVLASFITPTNEYREMIKEIIGEKNFKLIYVKAPLKLCEKRDPQGLYRKARAGEIKQFTGIDSPFEEPINPDLVLNTEKNSLDKCIEIFYEFYDSVNSK